MHIRTVALTTSILLGSTQVYAAEGVVLLEQLVALAGVEGSKITWGSIAEEDASSFTLFDVMIEDKSGQKAEIKTVSVRGLKDANGRLTYESIAVVDAKGDTDNGGNFVISGIGTSQGDWPSGIWGDGLTADEKRQRVRFGNFSFSGIAVTDKDISITLDSVVIANADIPLDYRYESEQASKAVGDAAKPLTFDQFSLVGLNGTGKTDDKQNVDFAMKSFNISNASLPTSQDASINEWLKLYSAVSINGITASLESSPVFALENITATLSPPDADATISMVNQLSGLMIDLLAIPDPSAQAVLKEVGYEKIEGSMSGAGNYNPVTGRAAVFDTGVKLKEMFDLSLDYAITGYTAELAQMVAKGQMEIAAGKDQMAVFGPMLAELSGIKLESFGINLTDHSITGRLLDFQAKQMGTTGEQLASGAPMMIGMGMGGLNMPALTEMVTAAVGKFLANPGTLSVRAMPVEPVAVINVVMTGQSDPAKIPDMLNLQISAE